MSPFAQRLDRRRFLGLLGAGTLVACEGKRGSTASTSPPPTAASSAGPPTTIASATGRALVVVQLGGGNDALNTLVPLTGRYHDLRPTIGLADDTLLPVAGTTGYGLHPGLKPMTALLDRTAIVASVGFPSPDRSHFVATDDWLSARPGEAATTGWLGRYLDATVGRSQSTLRAVALGSGTLALLGGDSRPTVVSSPQAFSVQARGDKTRLIEAWATVGGRPAVDAVAALDIFDELKINAAAAPTTDDAEGGEITEGLRTAADLLVSGNGVEIVNVAVGGFDTHSGQPTTHAGLLADLAGGLSEFFAQIEAAGLADRVMVMTVSEFGRRTAENASEGTDHGKAGVQFLLGAGVRPGLIGDVSLTDLDDGDLRAGIDPRTVYATVLDWLGGSADDVLGASFPRLW